MISVWQVIAIGVFIGLIISAINITIGIVLGKKSSKAFEEHMKRMNEIKKDT